MKKNDIYSIAREVKENHQKELEKIGKKMVKEAAEKFSKKFGKKGFINKSGKNGYTASQDWISCCMLLESFASGWMEMMMGFEQMHAMEPAGKELFKKNKGEK